MHILITLDPVFPVMLAHLVSLLKPAKSCYPDFLLHPLSGFYLSWISCLVCIHAEELDDKKLARKLKLLTFSRNWESRLVFTKGYHHKLEARKNLVQPIECWKTPSWERNISEHDIL